MNTLVTVLLTERLCDCGNRRALVQTDATLSERIKQGGCELSKEFFDTALHKYPQTSKEEFFVELAAYETKFCQNEV